MIEIGAELVIASPFQNSSYGPVEKIGIPIIEGADYMEAFPLGRTEWIRFYGLLFGKEEMADSIFKETEQAYLSLKDLTANIDNRPTVCRRKSSALRGMYHPEIVIWLILSRTPELIICLRIYRVPEVPP